MEHTTFKKREKDKATNRVSPILLSSLCGDASTPEWFALYPSGRFGIWRPFPFGVRIYLFLCSGVSLCQPSESTWTYTRYSTGASLRRSELGDQGEEGG